jgi:hypothetical protein
MKRLIVGSLLSVPLMFVAACSGDPTESLRNGIVQLNASPSQIFVLQGRTAKVKVSAIDEQGNLISTSFDASNVGSGITVERDLTFQPEFVNDTTLAPPEEATVFQFNVDAVNLVSTTFTLNAGGKSVDVPVIVTADPASVPAATVTTNGATAADPITVSIAAPLIFTSASQVATDAGAGIVTSLAADGSSITFFAPPGTTTAATIDSLGLSYLPTPSGVSVTTDVPLTIGTSVPPEPGTDNPATAPDVTPAPGTTKAFYDGTAFGSTSCGAFNAGAPCQMYKITLDADGSFDVSLGESGTTDLGVYLLSADGTTDLADNGAPFAFPPGSPCDVNGNDGTPESCTWTEPAGTYLLAVVNFGPFYSPPDPTPTWISLSITRP